MSGLPSLPALTTRGRWLFGGGLAIAAVAVAAAAVLLLGARPTPDALTYVPGGSVAVAELRLDLPGDQLEHVGNLLAHFPGFKDQSTLTTKIDETLDRLVTDASGGSISYSGTLAPWLAGPLFVGVTSLGTDGPAGYVVVATTNGKVSCADVPGGAVSGSQLAQGATCHMEGRFGLVGTPDAVAAAIAAHAAGTGIDHDADYRAARDALGGDRLATLYASGSAAGQLVAGVSLPIAATDLTGLPAWAMVGLRAEDDALVTDLVTAPAAAGSSGASQLPSLPPPHASQVSAFVPGDAMLVAEAHGAGVAAQAGLGALLADPQFQSIAGGLDSALSLAGGPDALVGWVDDAAIVVLPNGPDPSSFGVTGGLVLVAHDEATATAKAQELRSVLSLAALGGGGAPVDEPFEGTTITTVDLGPISTLLGSAGGPGSIGGLPIPPDAHLQLSVAVRGRLVLLGGDSTFARAMLGVSAGETLADQAAYRQAISRAAASNIGQIYVAGDALRALGAQLIPADQLDHWQTDLLPYAEPVAAIIATTTVEGGRSHTSLVISVSNPTTSP